MARAIDADEFMKRLILDTSKGFYGEYMDGSDTAYTFREIDRFVDEMPTLTPPNEPLTIEQLREMEDPVWCVCKTVEGFEGFWCLCNHGYILTPARQIFDVKEIPHWVFYRRPPEGGL